MSTTIASTLRRPVPSGALMTVTAMTCIQIGHAVSIGLLDTVGVGGTAWMRLAWAAVLVLLLVRPRLSALRGSTLVAALLLGVVTAGATLLFLAAVARIPLGTASAIEFLGPLGVAIARSRVRVPVAPLLAGGGVVLLTQPWQGGTDPVGVALALGAAACWGAYILLTEAVGAALEGLQGLAISLPVAALVATAAAGKDVLPALAPELLLLGLPLALLVPLVPFSLELVALRRLPTAMFGTLMSLEPALALLAGLVFLGQLPSWESQAGIVLVIAAGIGAARAAGRRPVADRRSTGGRPVADRWLSAARSSCAPSGAASASPPDRA